MKTFLTCFLVLVAATGFARTGKYWVEFRDKAIKESEFVAGNPVYDETLRRFSPDAIAKRKQLVREGTIKGILTIEDAPLTKEYINSLTSLGLHIRSEIRWSNAVSAEIPDELLAEVGSRPFVKNIKHVLRGVKQSQEQSLSPFLFSSFSNNDQPQLISREYGYDSIIYHYGGSASQLERTGVRPLHAMGLDATKVKIGFMDTGFRWEGMRTTKDRNVVFEYDYVSRDSVTSNEINDEPDQDGHGSVVLSAAVGYLPDSVIGAAYNADIYLAKTEDLKSETPAEEDNYAESIEYFESQGVRVASSSLGYMFYDFGFTSYVYEDLDGKTTISARAASHAATLGMLCVTAMGNGGTSGYPYLITPADADSVIAVGALDVNDTIAAFSSLGPSADGRTKPEVVAPGVKVWTMNNADMQAEAGGTSLATPLVSSACAVIMQAHPWASSQQVRKAVVESAIQHPIPDNTYGYGRIDAYGAALKLGTLIAPHSLWNDGTSYMVQVGIAANNGVKTPRIIYAYNVGGAYNNVLPLGLMTDSLIYRATFPTLPKGTHVRYYIETQDGADTITLSPRNAPDSVYSFYVGDSIPNPPYSVKKTEDVQIALYPNPARDYINITLPLSSESVELVDVLGRVIRSAEVNRYTVGLKISLQGLEEGIYSVIIRKKDGEVSARKIVVTR
ncbi:MAG TPA: S8/S53 family peptidase [Candidatus Kapabacteria bacterium]